MLKYSWLKIFWLLVGTDYRFSGTTNEYISTMPKAMIYSLDRQLSQTKKADYSVLE